MVLVDWTVSISPAGVRQIPPHGPLEKGFATCGRDFTIVMLISYTFTLSIISSKFFENNLKCFDTVELTSIAIYDIITS